MRLEQPLRLAIVSETFPPEVNGVASTLYRFVEGLCRRGHHIDLIRPRQAHEQADTYEPPAHPWREILFRGLAIPRYSELRLGLPARRALRRIWSAQPPEVVHISTEGPLGWSALRAAIELGLPVTSDFRTNFDAYSAYYGIGWLGRPIGAYLKRFHNRCQVTTVPTEAMYLKLQALGYRRLQVVARGVDTELFNPAKRDPALRRRWGATEQAPVVLYVGRLAPEKNLGMLGSAWRAIRERRPDARLVLVGDGPARARLQAVFPEAYFAGMRSAEDLAAHYASADLFLFPSITETFGNVTLEAMASGLAIIAYDYAAAGEHLIHGTSGCLVPVGEPEAMVRHAVDLVEAPEVWRSLGRQARDKAVSLGWPVLVEKLESVLLGARTAGLAELGPAQRSTSSKNVIRHVTSA